MKSLFRSSVVVLGLLGYLVASRGGDANRLNGAELTARGLPGALIVDTDSRPDSATLQAFVSSVGAKPGHWVVLEWLDGTAVTATSTKSPAVESGPARPSVGSELLSLVEQAGSGRLDVIRLAASEAPNAAVLQSLASAHAVWLQATNSATLRDQFKADSALRVACQTLRQRGGTVGGNLALAETIATWGWDEGTSTPRATLDWLPGFALMAGEAARQSATGSTAADKNKWSEFLQQTRKVVGLRLPPHSAVLVRGRELQTLRGEGAWFDFVATPWHAAESKQLETRQRLVDLPAVQRYQRDRHAEPYPPADPVTPVVPNGTLIIIGGGRTPRAVFDRFVREAGGPKASIVVLPIAMPDPLPAADPMAESLKKAGVGEVTVLAQRFPEDVTEGAALDALRRATGVWFGGGRQWRFVDAYEGTEAERLMHGVLARGGVIAGSSAGASIQGDFLVRGHPLGPQYMECAGYLRGLGFLPGVAIDQHFTQRNRHNDLRQLIDRYPQFLGIGLDESTAIVVKNSNAEVVGEHRVHFFVGASNQNERGLPRVEALGAGAHFDLLHRVPRASSITGQSPESAVGQ